MPRKPVVARALYDYNRTHTDELSFKKGDVISVSQQLDGGWWEGSLNGDVGWFPSNYVTVVACAGHVDSPRTVPDEASLAHLRSFQDEIVQHILEGEVRQVNELVHLVSSVITHLEAFSFLPLMNKIFHMKEILTQAVHLHQALAEALNATKQSPGPKRVGKLFLHFAPTVNAIGCDYSKIHLYIITGLDKNADLITHRLSSLDINFNLVRCKQQLGLIFDRLGRYPLLLKEMERYLENPHVDREDIQNALTVYGEITERCAILRKFKEYDIEILLSTINGWQGPPIDKLGDPVLTLRVTLNDLEQDPMHSAPPPMGLDCAAGRLCVLVTFPTCVLLLARTKQPGTYDFMTKVALNSLIVIGCPDVDTDIDLVISSKLLDRKSVCPARLSLGCADRNARDLLLSTLTDLIHYQTLGDRLSWVAVDQSASSAAPIVSSGVEAASQSVAITGDSSSSDISPGPPVYTSGKSYGSPDPGVRDPHSIQSTAATTTSMVSSMPSTTASATVSVSSAYPTDHTSDQSLDAAPMPHSPSVPENKYRFLSHQLTASAHVRWPDKPKTEGPFVPGCVRSIRLDGPTGLSSGGVAPRASSFVNLGSNHHLPPHQSYGSNAPAARSDAGGESQLGFRPHSPKGDGAKETRRKKSDRQKSAINVDEVLRTVDKLRDDERRNADAARILQVVEAYCASAWTNIGCQSLDLTQLNVKDSTGRIGPVVFSPSKTFLHSLTTNPARTAATGTNGTTGQPTADSKPGHKSSLRELSRPRMRLSPVDAGESAAAAASATDSSVLQTMVPPPVILPTRNGRRL